MSDGVRLAWVMLGEKPCPVSVFAGVPPEQRPEVTCPACGEPVVLRLGPRLAHHAAHRAGQECAASVAESALHLNCKLRIAAQLRGRGDAGLRISQGCAVGRPGCAGPVERPWMRGWDTVAVELKVGSLRPDIVLLQDEIPLGVIEVCVHSAVTLQKRYALAAAGLPWIETPGSPEAAIWTADTPLPISASDPSVPLRCGACARWSPPVRLSPQEADPWRHTLRGYSAHTIRARAFAQSAPGAASRTPQTHALMLYDRHSPQRAHRQRGALLCVHHEGRWLLWDTLTQRAWTAKGLGDAQAHGRRCVRALRRQWVVDTDARWWSPADALAHAPLCADWSARGARHRWGEALPGLPPRGPLATTMDLARFLLDTHLRALPARWVWAAGGWQRGSTKPWRPWPTTVSADSSPTSDLSPLGGHGVC